MSSHREAPEISKDPVADNTDTYAFVSPDNPDTVTIITNYLPAEAPAGGPTFYEFGNDVLYTIHIDNNGDGVADIEYLFTFESKIENPNTFLYNTGPIKSLSDPNWSKRQFYTVVRRDKKGATVVGEGLACPPSNIGPRSTPNYESLAAEAVHSLENGQTVFAGQRNDPFFVDIGSIFDLADLRPFQNLHIFPEPATKGTDTLATLNVHSIAIQVPIKSLTSNGKLPTGVMSSNAVLGIWGSASRRRVRIAGEGDEHLESGRSCRSRGSPTRCSTRCSSRWRARTSGTARHPAKKRSSSSSWNTPSWPNCCRCSTRTCSPTSQRSKGRAPTWSPSCSRASPRA